MDDLRFPNGRRFAFTIIDDTDVATVANVAPLYRLLEELGMRTTKTVWPVACPEGSEHFAGSETLEDPDYREFAAGLQLRGFELTWHGATMESSTRERTARGLEAFRVALGGYPRIHVNHADNRENLYWGAARVDDPLLRTLLALRAGDVGAPSAGADRDSPYWWGDLCAQHITYARNLTFRCINLARINPSMPYRDPARPLVPWWFSSSDADSVHEFNALISPRQQDRLEAEGGFCIVATHFGKGFVQDGRVHAETRRLLEALSRRPGWFPTAGTLLDWLRERRRGAQLPRAEWRNMQWRWAWDMVGIRLTERLRPRPELNDRTAIRPYGSTLDTERGSS